MRRFRTFYGATQRVSQRSRATPSATEPLWLAKLVPLFKRTTAPCAKIEFGLRGSASRLVASLLLCLVLPQGDLCHLLADEIQLETDSLSKDYAAELPRIPPTSPKDSLSKFQIAANFRIELAAHEPLITDPIAMAFDEKGRLFVVCMNGYSEDGGLDLGVVRMLEDTNGDGKFDKGTNYVEDLSWPTAVACYDGGIFVAAAPEILFFKDVDGDGISDERKVIFQGFRRNNVQGMLNSFRWGLNNRLYGASGTNGGSISKAGLSKTTELRGLDFSLHPNTLSLHPESGGAQHGATWDRWGERFVCSNSDHIQWIEFEHRHLHRNPLLNGFRSRRSIAIEGPAAEVFRASDVEPWRIVRTRLRVKGMVRGPVEGGGRAAGYFTSASGITAYTGDAFPADFQANDYVFIGDVGSNLVHLKRINTEGLDKQARRATENNSEFLTSTDNWFRPVQFANGPDGNLYVIDMYREVIEHPLSLPPMIKKHLDLTSGRDRGRIYRIVAKEEANSDLSTQKSKLLPASATPEELVEMLGDANGWHRETAARLIVTRSNRSNQEATRFALLLNGACQATSPHARIRALYCLQSIGRLSEPTLVQQLNDDHPQVRRHALKVVESTNHLGEATISQLREMIKDSDVGVRYQRTLALGKFPAEVRRDMLAAIAELELADSSSPSTLSQYQRRMQFALLSSMGDDRMAMFRLLGGSAFDPKVPNKLEMLAEIARQIGKSNSSVDAAIRFIQRANTNQFRLTTALFQGSGKRGIALKTWLDQHRVEGADQLIKEIINTASTRALNVDGSLEDRIYAIGQLGFGSWNQVGETFANLISPSLPGPLRNAAVKEMGKFSEVEVAKMLIESAPSLPPQGRRQAYDLLTTRPAWTRLLLTSLQQGETPSTQLAAAQRDRLFRHKNQEISRRAAEVLGVQTDRVRVLKDYTASVLNRKGNVERGRSLFKKTCATCHRLDNVGISIGPDLTPLRNRGAFYMLTNILVPNREVDSRYEAYQVVTTDGRNLTGLLIRDTAKSVELQQADNRSVVVDKDNVAILQATGRSLMPDGLERDLGEQGVADVIAYLIQQ